MADDTEQPMPRRPAAPTLADVAARASVSTATVSRVLNAPERVQHATRARVEAAVAELGYAPNFGARALAARRTDTIGAIVPTLENAIFARGLEAFQAGLAGAGVTMLVSASGYDPAKEAEQVRTLVARGADALLLIGHDRDPSVHDFLDRRAIPSLVAWAWDPTATRPSIGFDNFAAMRAMTEAVLDMGHRRLGLLSARREGNDRARHRWRGAMAAVTARGLSEDALALHETNYGIEEGRSGLRALLARAPDLTAVLCGNDVLAAGALMAARELGRSVPDDLSITGFDDIEIAQIVTPRLTTVHVPHREMGRRAATHLVALRDGTAPEGSIRLETELRLRGTLAPPPEA